MATLYEKVYGCLAASRVGSAMGAAVEGWSPERIEETYGFVDQFYSYLHYGDRGVDWQRMPGTTEDGIERQKLMCRAIIAKQDRITAQDLAKEVAEATDLSKAWYMTQPEDLRIIEFMKAGVPAVEVGRVSGWNGLNFARATQPIGLINAGDPEGAVRDVMDIGRLFFPPTDSALVWSGVYDAAIAEALKPDATINSVIATSREYATDRMKAEIDRTVDLAASLDSKEMRNEFYKYYNGTGIPYAMCYANETVCKALAIFVNVGGDAKQAILDGVNFGRDTDCLAASAGGLAGAFSGIGAVPQEWVDQLDKATTANPYTNTICTVKEHADGVHAALKNRAQKMRELASLLES